MAHIQEFIIILKGDHLGKDCTSRISCTSSFEASFRGILIFKVTINVICQWNNFVKAPNNCQLITIAFSLYLFPLLISDRYLPRYDFQLLLLTLWQLSEDSHSQSVIQTRVWCLLDLLSFLQLPWWVLLNLQFGNLWNRYPWLLEKKKHVCQHNMMIKIGNDQACISILQNPILTLFIYFLNLYPALLSPKVIPRQLTKDKNIMQI